MIKKYRHISFDLDGTLVFTKPEYRYEIVPRVISNLGGYIPKLKIIDAFWFNGNRDQLIEEHFRIPPELFWPEFRKHDKPSERNKFTEVYEDVESVFSSLKANKKVTSIITGSPAHIANLEMKKIKSSLISITLCLGDGDFQNKPSPEGLIHIMQKLSILPKDTIYIGNSKEDAIFAKNAGVDFIYIDRQAHDFHASDKAVATIHSLHEILPKYK